MQVPFSQYTGPSCSTEKVELAFAILLVSMAFHLFCNFLPPVYGVWWEGYVLTRVCLSVHGGGQSANSAGGVRSAQGGQVQLGGSASGGGSAKIGQHREYLLHGGRYASCVHAGGLSCFTCFRSITHCLTSIKYFDLRGAEPVTNKCNSCHPIVVEYFILFVCVSTSKWHDFFPYEFI